MRPSYDALHNERCAYVLGEAETPFGLTLGNLKTYASSTAKGGVRGLWDADTDRIVFGTQQIAYRLRDAARTLTPAAIERRFTFLPYAQVSEFALDERLLVTECFYVPCGAARERDVAFVVDVVLHNAGAAPVEASVFPWALLVGQRFYGEPETEVHAHAERGAICAWNETSGGARCWGASRAPHAAVVSVREQVLLQAMGRGTLREEDHVGEVTPGLAESVRGRVFGAFEYRVTVAPGERETLRLACVYDGAGRDAARARFDALAGDAQALGDTERFYAERLADARFAVPSPVVSRGVVWAKANMLRIVKDYPHGRGSTNSPPSDILVSRDTSWFAHGFDWFAPDFSRDALDVFNRFLEPSGKVVEYVRGASGSSTSYDLNINDDTPLHLVALLHHYNATRDAAWARGLLPAIVRVADYLLSQRDPNGLVFCRAAGVDMYGITSWRNIIPYYRLDGAVTEINAEAVFALESAATLCAVAGDAANARRYAAEAAGLRERVMRHLFDADTGAFALNYDADGAYRDDFTADEVFPVLFGIADPAQRRAILARLAQPDFATEVGLRTISTADAWYFPSHGFGLLGGVWPDLTLWFAVALARDGDPAGAAAWLERIYAAMEAGSARNTVPGQFGEWFDGGSLTNRGMYLSPWTGAKYLWAVAETACGLDGYRTAEVAHLAPLLPPHWRWATAARVRLGGGRCTYVVDAARARIVGDLPEATAAAPYAYEYAGRDVTAELAVAPMDAAAVAFEAADGSVRAFVCALLDGERAATVAFRGATRTATIAAGDVVELAFPPGPAGSALAAGASGRP